MDLTPEEIWKLRNIVVRAVSECQEVLSGAARRAKAAAKAVPPAAAQPAAPPPVVTVPMAPRETKLAYSVQETALVLSISRSTLYKLMGAGDLRAIHIGQRTVIERSAIEAFLARARARV
jgi:excisionase family DNA binding protein